MNDSCLCFGKHYYITVEWNPFHVYIRWLIGYVVGNWNDPYYALTFKVSLVPWWNVAAFDKEIDVKSYGIHECLSKDKWSKNNSYSTATMTIHIVQLYAITVCIRRISNISDEICVFTTQFLLFFFLVSPHMYVCCRVV